VGVASSGRRIPFRHCGEQGRGKVIGMTGTFLRRVAVLATIGVFAGGGVASAWEGKGNNKGWDNKQERGCPDDYAPASAAEEPFVDLNDDGTICMKVSGNSGPNFVDNISNH
jgi:hypothetical protein